MPAKSDARFAELVASFESLPGVTPPGAPGSKKRFGADALKVDGKIFAMLVDECLVVKLPKARVEELAVAGHGVQFDPGHGRLMKEWLALEPEAPVEWSALATEAMTFVRSGAKGHAR